MNTSPTELDALALLENAFPGIELVEIRPGQKSRRSRPVDHTAAPSLISAVVSASKLEGCEHPIRLTGSLEVTDAITGDVVHQFSTEHDTNDNAIYVPCKTRRASRCKPCSRIYQNDAYQLIVGGLQPGDFFDESILGRPALFVTLTAPSFGPVHSAHSDDSRCRPRRGGDICPHGRNLACWEVHSNDETCVGQALCEECFDYRSAVVWNASAGALWRATIVDFERRLAEQLDVTVKELRGTLCRVRFVKIAEMQHRGLVHFHVAIRLDGPNGTTPELVEPVAEDLIDQVSHKAVASLIRQLVTDDDHASAHLAIAVARTVQHVDVPSPIGGDISWGGVGFDVKVIGTDIEREKLAGYFAKYATKSADARGLLDSRIQTKEQIDCLPVNAHQRRLVRAAWSLAEHARAIDAGKPPRKAHEVKGFRMIGTVRIVKVGDVWRLTVTGGLAMNARMRICRHFASRDDAFAFLRTLEAHPNPLRDLNVDRWAHQFGFRGHFLTKSRTTESNGTAWPGWSTTFAALRQRRADHNAAIQEASWQALSPNARLNIEARWEYAGSGYRTPTETHVAALVRDDQPISADVAA